MIDKIAESLAARDILFDELAAKGGEVLFTKDTFKLIPITKVDIEYPTRKKKQVSFWSFGTLRNAKNSGFSLPLSPWKVLLYSLFFANIIVMLNLYPNYWDLQDLLNLDYIAFLKLIPALYSIIVLVLSIIWVAKRRNFKNIAILGTDESKKMTLFTLSALHIQEAGYGEILDIYFREYSKTDQSEISDFNPKSSQTYTLEPERSNPLFNHYMKFLNLNSRTLIEPEVSILTNLKKIIDGYIIIICTKDSPNPDQALSDYFSELEDIKKLRKAKILFLLDTKFQTENPDDALLSVIPQTLGIIQEHLKEENYQVKFLTIEEELITQYNKKAKFIDENIMQPMKWLI
jgi:hypothetical protein